MPTSEARAICTYKGYGSKVCLSSDEQPPYIPALADRSSHLSTNTSSLHGAFAVFSAIGFEGQKHPDCHQHEQ